MNPAKLLLTIISIISCLACFSQKRPDSISFSDEDIAYWLNDSNPDLILRDPKTSKLILYRVYKGSSKNISYELIRKSDSSFVLLEYDSMSNPIAGGEMQIDLKNYDSTILEIPDFSKDSDGSKGIMKDTILRRLFLKKHDFWQETDTAGFVWTGNYHFGKKTGTWIKGKYFPIEGRKEPKYFRIESINYKNDIPDSLSLFYFDSIMFPKLKGLWVYDHLRGRPHTFEKDSVVLSNEEFLSFINENTYQYNCLREKPKHSFDYVKCTDKWWLENNYLNLARGKSVLRFKIVQITDRYLRLEPMEDSKRQ